MKIQCNVCEVAEAKVLCCADEAALCWECDEKVHAANKLASKHQRLPLSSCPTQIPKCDICQEASGFFFCLQDRSLLCRKCDVAIHSVNSHVSAHQRFLLTGVNVGLEASQPGASSSTVKSLSCEVVSDTKSHSVAREGTPMPGNTEYNEVLPVNVGGVSDFATNQVSFAGGSATGSTPSWHMDDFLSLPELNQNYGFMDHGSSKADSGKCGDSDSSSFLRSAEEELDDDEYLGQVPESRAVPQIPSPPTASGLYWPKDPQNLYTSVFVPDVYYHSPHIRPAKRRWRQS